MCDLCEEKQRTIDALMGRKAAQDQEIGQLLAELREAEGRLSAKRAAARQRANDREDKPSSVRPEEAR